MPETPKPDRVASVDALRGFAMFWLIGGQTLLFALAAWLGSPHITEYVRREFEHPPWSGFHWWDCVMPTFIFVSGVTIPLSITRRVERGESKLLLYGRILRRAIVLVTLNVIVNGGLNTLDFHQMRCSGVLSRLGVAYAFAAMTAPATAQRLRRNRLALAVRTFAEGASPGPLSAFWRRDEPPAESRSAGRNPLLAFFARDVRLFLPTLAPAVPLGPLALFFLTAALARPSA